MPPRIRLSPSLSYRLHTSQAQSCTIRRCYASVATSITNADSQMPEIIPEIAIRRHDPSQPPSHRRPEVRKTQLLRQYVSLIRNCPIVLVFQHNSLLATELTAIRTMLTASLRKVDAAQDSNYADHIKLQVMRTGLLDTALRLVQFWQHQHQTSIDTVADAANEPRFTHSLSEEAFQSLTENEEQHGLEPLLSGPIAMLTLPWMSPEHLKLVLSLLSPSPEFPAPKRRVLPAYYEPSVQNGLSKLILLGARIEGRSMDVVKTRWVGGVSGGIDGLRAQLVAALQGMSSNLVNTLDSPSRSLSIMLEGRRKMLDEDKVE